ncbi:hypothetical protein NCAS_0A08900 [Naumovozyma castellii]|uniref:t-SNARE coiled-coil homology domain-containing protein n=1 Tax=Naumovozyma castellii TaxID=27288 RepID=G0V7K0_NAUCA|nr:hypothetical protein NCAS_0A08900 [Naumovozyma castellii CBS 4309]CCC67448.1 hypothetical protein NCAS_0A08900 [Naumovozyma castellii CBS 4309]
MFRDRTNLFLSYRRTFPHNAQFSTIGSGRKPFQDNENVGDLDLEAYPMVDMDSTSSSGKLDTLPPLFVEIARDIDEYLIEVASLMGKLTKLYKKNSLPGFEDKSRDESVIEDLSYKVIQNFQKCYNITKKLEKIFNTQMMEGKQLNKGELIILDNILKRYAQKIQGESNRFRVLQNSYLKFLNKDDLKPISAKPESDTSQMLLFEMEDNEQSNVEAQQDIDAYSRKTLQRQQELTTTNESSQQFLQQRDEEITQLAKGVLEVSTIFREMQGLIIDQGTVVDRIDYNLQNTTIQLKEANKELGQATVYQKRTQKCKIILLLSLCVIALFFFVMLKPSSSGGGGGGEGSRSHTDKQEDHKTPSRPKENNNSPANNIDESRPEIELKPETEDVKGALEDNTVRDLLDDTVIDEKLRIAII